MYEPSYLRLFREGELSRRAEKALRLMESCSLCPRECGMNRLKDEVGFCKTGRKARVASFNAHFGEEAPLVGRHGSGTIFISSCNLLCSFCQNFDLSHLNEGMEVEPAQTAAMMMGLAERGCHNINIVTPTHVVPQILEALLIAVEQGLRIPLVYNTGGYDKRETLEILDGVVDIYMPDFKFWDAAASERYCGISDYREVAAEAVREMHRQVGDLVLDERGIARRGLILRHLVMPNDISGTSEVMNFIANEISTDTYVNLMDQYRPCGHASGDAFVNRTLTTDEFKKALESATKAGLGRLDKRERFRLVFTR